MPAGHVCPPHPVRTSSWSFNGRESWLSNVMSVSPFVFRLGSGARSSLMAKGSSGGDIEGLLVTVDMTVGMAVDMAVG